jgi:hypothetical protein
LLDEEKELGDILGEERDLSLLGSRLSEPVPAGMEEARDLLVEEVAKRRKALRKQAFERAADMFSEPPKAFAKKLCVCWQR